MPLNDFLKRLLGWHRRSAIAKSLERPPQFVNAYQEWVNAQAYLNWTIPFYKAYHDNKANLPSKLRVQLVEEKYVCGILLFYDPCIREENFTFLFDLLRDRVLIQGYTLHSSDRFELHHERYTEQVEKHRLVPPASDLQGTSLCNQLYGNVLIDYVKINGRPGYIRFAANPYADSFFSKPLPFPELLKKVLHPTDADNYRNTLS